MIRVPRLIDLSLRHDKIINLFCSFQGVMVRLMLVLAPVMCILSGIAVSSTLTTYMKNLDVSRKDKKTKKADINYPVKNEVSLSSALVIFSAYRINESYLALRGKKCLFHAKKNLLCESSFWGKRLTLAECGRIGGFQNK